MSQVGEGATSFLYLLFFPHILGLHGCIRHISVGGSVVGGFLALGQKELTVNSICIHQHNVSQSYWCQFAGNKIDSYILLTHV